MAVFAREVALGRAPPLSLAWEVWETAAASLQMLYKVYMQGVCTRDSIV